MQKWMLNLLNTVISHRLEQSLLHSFSKLDARIVCSIPSSKAIQRLPASVMYPMGMWLDSSWLVFCTPEVKFCTDGSFCLVCKDFGWRLKESFPACAFLSLLLSGDQLMCTNSTLLAKIGPLWLSKLRWPWKSVSWWVTCELSSLIGSHTIPGQHNQPTLDFTGSRVFVFSCNLLPALLAEWWGSFTCCSSEREVELTLNTVSTESWHWRQKFFRHFCQTTELFQPPVLCTRSTENTRKVCCQLWGHLNHFVLTLTPSKTLYLQYSLLLRLVWDQYGSVLFEISAPHKHAWKSGNSRRRWHDVLQANGKLFAKEIKCLKDSRTASSKNFMIRRSLSMS